MSDFSLLRQPWSAPPRELYDALAHCLAATRLSDVRRMELLNRTFESLTWGDQQRCRAELVRCKQAQRGQVLAVVK